MVKWFYKKVGKVRRRKHDKGRSVIRRGLTGAGRVEIEVEE